MFEYFKIKNDFFSNFKPFNLITSMKQMMIHLEFKANLEFTELEANYPSEELLVECKETRF